MLRDRLKIMLVKVCFLKCLSLGRDTSLFPTGIPFFCLITSSYLH